MKKLPFLFILFIFPLFSQMQEGPRPHRYEHTLSIAAFFQQEARFLKEWIEFHLLVGVEHFYLYNNNSEDNYLEVLQPYIDWGIVELSDWPSTPGEKWTSAQQSAMLEALERAKLSSRWVAIIDIDEFLVPHEGDTLIEFLLQHEDFSQIVLPWKMFGTSYIERIPDSTLMIEALTMREAYDPDKYVLTKTIMKPQAVQRLFIHESPLKPNRKSLNLKELYTDNPPLSVHHYWTRDGEFLRKVKKERQLRVHKHEWSEEETEHYFSLYNDVEDLTMRRFVPELKKRIFNR